MSQSMKTIGISDVIDKRVHPLCQEALACGLRCGRPCEAEGTDKSKPSVKHYRPRTDEPGHIPQISTVSWSSLWSDKCYYHNSLKASENFAIEVKEKKRREREEETRKLAV